MEGLLYNSSKDRYSIRLENGKFLVVEGSEMAEAVSDGGDLDELCQDIPMWESLIGDNQNAYYALTPWGNKE